MVPLGRVQVLLLLAPARRPAHEVGSALQARARHAGPRQREVVGPEVGAADQRLLVGGDLEAPRPRPPARWPGPATTGRAPAPRSRGSGRRGCSTSRFRMAAMSRSGNGGFVASAWEPISPDSSAAKPTNTSERAASDAAPDERLRGGQHPRRARGVVLGAVVDRVAVDRGADPEVIVVAADQHRLPRERAPARPAGPGRSRSRSGGSRSAPVASS